MRYEARRRRGASVVVGPLRYAVRRMSGVQLAETSAPFAEGTAYLATSERMGRSFQNGTSPTGGAGASDDVTDRRRAEDSRRSTSCAVREKSSSKVMTTTRVH